MHNIVQLNATWMKQKSSFLYKQFLVSILLNPGYNKELT